MEQLDVIREMIQKKIPDKKVRNVWTITEDFQNNILYGVSGNPEPFKVEKLFGRGLQIYCYLKRHPEIKNFVIFDDSNIVILIYFYLVSILFKLIQL